MIHKVLKVIRQYHSLSQTEMAEMLDISGSYLSEIESNKKTISLDLIDRYSTIFNIPVSSIVFFAENLEQDDIPERFRSVFCKKIIIIMEWLNDRKNLKGREARKKAS